MANKFKASRDIIVRTEDWSEALEFYGSVLGLPITIVSETIVDFETGAFCLYVSEAKNMGRSLTFSFRHSRGQAATRSSRLHRNRGEPKDPALLHQRPLRYDVQCRTICR